VTQKFRYASPDASGFSLIELLLVVLIIGVLSAMALNYTGTMQRGQKLAETQRGFVRAVSQASFEAQMRGQNVLLQVNKNVDFTVFLDLDKDGQYSAAGDTLLFSYVLPSSYGQSTVFSQATTAVGQRLVFVFNPQGFSQDASAKLLPIVFCASDPQIPEVRVVAVSLAGAVLARTMTTSSPGPSSMGCANPLIPKLLNLGIVLN
jgi:prepilin-type N-terminal cleavage/methylation domain-containing protein